MLIHILIGALLGTLAGLGTGGGSLLVLWLTLVQGMDQPTARTVNLMFFLPCALIAGIAHLRQGAIDYRKLLLPTVCGCVAAAVFTALGKQMDTDRLRKLFGVLLIFTSFRELSYRPRKPK